MWGALFHGPKTPVRFEEPASSAVLRTSEVLLSELEQICPSPELEALKKRCGLIRASGKAPDDLEHECCAEIARFATGIDKQKLEAGDTGDALAAGAVPTGTDKKTAKTGAKEGLDLVALCLSGGGIRSAAFGLGVLQGLADKGLLHKVHYLSTVSGGGYIGSWLSAWLLRERVRGTPRNVIYAKLSDRSLAADEPRPVRWLRAYSQYLTPKVGLMSADTWTTIALYIRNLILNWLVIASALGLAVMLVKGVAITSYLTRHAGDDTGAFLALRSLPAWLFFLVASGGAMLLGLGFATRGRPTWRVINPGQTRFLRWDLAPMSVGAIAWMLFVRTHTEAIALPGDGDTLWGWPQWWASIPLIACGAGLYLLAWVAALLSTGRSAEHVPTDRPSERGSAKRPGGGQPTTYEQVRSIFYDGFCWTLAGAVFGFLLMYGSTRYLTVLYYLAPPNESRDLVLLALCVVPAWVLFCHLVAEAVFLGLRSYDHWGDDTREWLARSAGWYGVAAISWLVASLLVLYGAHGLYYWYFQLHAKLSVALAASGGIASGVATLLLSKSSWSAVAAAADGKKPWLVNVVIAVTAIIFTVLLVIGISAALDLIIFRGDPDKGFLWMRLADETLRASAFKGFAIEAGVLGLLCCGAPFFININRFSMHAVYRNRLTRAFLGASNDDRRPDRFTGFSEGDNLRMKDLWSRTGKGAVMPAEKPPFHIINITLNLVAGKRLDWQQRKAESFTVSPLASGSSYVGYRETASYGDPDGGLTLGTAMAISGAAASPNMGYHSSPAIGLLMTLFNVRLGWWLGNPGPAGELIGPGARRWLSYAPYQLDGPRWALKPLLFEAFGLTTDEHPYVYLSDGGHFDNLGLYEMVRRRCRYIIVSDAGCDPNFAFEDLGNAIRKIWIDQGVKIEMDGLDMLRPRGGATFSWPYFAIGTITYPEADAPEGKILYLKPGLNGAENADILAYARAHTDFPHEPTMNQWFNEAQFESYRALGQHILEKAWAAAARRRRHGRPVVDVADLF